MLPIKQLTSDIAQNIQFVLSDIDDTMTEDGKLPAAAYQALWDLHNAGIKVIPVTGRPAGWCASPKTATSACKSIRAASSASSAVADR